MGKYQVLRIRKLLVVLLSGHRVPLVCLSFAIAVLNSWSNAPVPNPLFLCHGFPNAVVESGKPRQKRENGTNLLYPLGLAERATDMPPRWGGWLRPVHI